MKRVFFAALLAAMVMGCSTADPDLPPVRHAEDNRAKVTVEANHNDEQPMQLLATLDPEQAEVKLDDDAPSLVVASQGSTLRVPGFSFTFDGSDFVQVLRCRKGYVLSDPTGETLPTAVEPGSSAGRWAWQEASGSYRDCKMVQTRLMGTEFKDLSAETGSFYYVLNPCVSKERSATGEDGCSYALEVTGETNYTNALNDQFIAQAVELAKAEATLATYTQTLIFISRQIRNKEKACEDMWAQGEARTAFWRGVVSMTAFVAGAVVAGVATDGAGAIAGGQAVLAIARPLFSSMLKEKPLKCPDVAKLVSDGDKLTNSFDTAVNNVDSIRKKMAAVQTGY